ncbi:alcohol dehydrogenase catalytic domain-containing protein [Nocardia salmonicida]|uniref:alcohol dehydrogenase catalytic domain-containing protein n=1 Tax=Nocardia salmonicida TaxID=53431 RepID=UPI002E2A41B0|nr:alcohol dehydrogenase catalytic domain-containing protein [Nocardia salmonicida]
MKTLTYEGPTEVRYSDIPAPEIRESHQALIEVSLAGICGSDLHIFDGHGFSATTGYSMGHEAVGVVREVGRDVTRFSVGDRVLIPASVGCSKCPPCVNGRVLSCVDKPSALESCYGLGGGLPGSQAQFVRVPQADGNLVALPSDVSDEAGVVLTDNAPTAWYGCRRARIGPGESVLVIGLGPVGLMSAQCAFAMGAAQVIGVDPVRERRELAQGMGVRTVESADDPKVEIRDLTKGIGPDAVIEAVGADNTITLALRAVRPRGRVSVIGVSQNRRFPFPMELAQVKELEFAIGLCSVQAELPALLALTQGGRLHPETVVSHRLPMSAGVKAYDIYRSRSDAVSKVVLDPRL